MTSRSRSADVRPMVAAHLPDYDVRSVEPVGEGQENVVYEVNGELLVRFRKEPDPSRRAALVDREARLLTIVAHASPVRVPEPIFAATDSGCLAYYRLPGVALLELPPHQRSAHGPMVGSALGQLLAGLHALDPDHLADLVDRDCDPLDQWRQEAADLFPAVATQVPAAHRPPMESFLDAEPPPDQFAPVFSHNDLGMEHVLIDPGQGTVTGVIDWSDAAITDPAYDFGLILRDLGHTALDAAVASYRTDTVDMEALRQRAVFYARCGVIEDLAFGLETGREPYVSKSLVSLGWLFPAV